MLTPGVPDPAANPATVRALYHSRQLDAIAARWDARAATWDSELQSPDCHLNHDNSYERFLQLAGELIQQRCDFCAGNGVIDSGCGTGLVLEQIAGHFAWGFGIDISPKMVSIAEGKKIRNCRFMTGDCFRLPELCPKAAAIFSRGVLLSHYGVEQGITFLSAMRESLLPGGFLVCDFLNESARLFQAHAPENKTYYSRASAIRLALDAGFNSATVAGQENQRALILIAEN